MSMRFKYPNYSLNVVHLEKKILNTFSSLAIVLLLYSPCLASHFGVVENSSFSGRFINRFAGDYALADSDLHRSIKSFKAEMKKAIKTQAYSSYEELYHETFVEIAQSLKSLESYLNEKNYHKDSLKIQMESILKIPYFSRLLIEDSNLDYAIKLILASKLYLNKSERPQSLLTIWPALAILHGLSSIGKFKQDGFDYERLIYLIATDYGMDLNHIEIYVGNTDTKKALLLLLPPQYMQAYLHKAMQYLPEEMQRYKRRNDNCRAGDLKKDLGDQASEILYLFEYFSNGPDSLQFLDSYLCYESLSKIGECLHEVQGVKWYRSKDDFCNLFETLSNILCKRLKRFNEDREDELFLSVDQVSQLAFMFNSFKNKKATLKALKLLEELIQTGKFSNKVSMQTFQRAAFAWYDQKEFGRSADYYNRVDEHASEKQLMPLDYARAALANYRQGDKEKALKYFIKMGGETNLPLKINDYYYLALIATKQNNLDLTQKHMRLAIDKPLGTKEYKELSQACFRAGLNELAIEASRNFARKYSEKIEKLNILEFADTLREVSYEFYSLGESLESYIGILETFEDHKRALEDAFKQAKRNILVTNFGGIKPEFESINLFASLRDDVTVTYIYDYKHNGVSIPNNIQNLFQKYKVDKFKTTIHTKIVIVDDWLVMIGSFNWFTDITPFKGGSDSYNRTFVCKGKAASSFIKPIEEAVNFYKNRESKECEHASDEKDLSKNKEYKHTSAEEELRKNYVTRSLPDGSKLTYLPTILQHRLLINRVFKQAEQRIIFLSPFVTGSDKKVYSTSPRAKENFSRIDETYGRDFNEFIKYALSTKHIIICFVINPHVSKFESARGEANNNKNFIDFNRYKEKTFGDDPRVKIIPFEGFHSKTLIMDKKLIAEGSFNWLKADRYEDSTFHKHEATFVYEGSSAETLIDKFYQGKIGIAIEKKIKDDEATLYSGREKEIIKDNWINSRIWAKSSEEWYAYTPEKTFRIYEFNKYSWRKRKGFYLEVSDSKLEVSDSKVELGPFGTITEAKGEAFDKLNK